MPCLSMLARGGLLASTTAVRVEDSGFGGLGFKVWAWGFGAVFKKWDEIDGLRLGEGLGIGIESGAWEILVC